MMARGRVGVAVLGLGAAVLVGGIGSVLRAARGPGEQALQIAVISDLNGSYGSTSYGAGVSDAIQRLVELRPDLVIFTGDLVAGQRIRPLLRRDEIEAMWDSFEQTVLDPLARAGIPIVATPGNHDASGYSPFRLERQIYAERWSGWLADLDMFESDGAPFNFAFELEGVLFLSLDAATVGPLDPGQRSWLKDVLERAGPRHRARIVFGHLPIWPIAVGREKEALFDDDLASVLRAGNVDLYLSGHHHAFYPGVRDGLWLVGQACVGEAPRTLIGSPSAANRALTFVTIRSDGSITVDAYTGPGYRERIDRLALPATIPGGDGDLVRDDLACVDPARDRWCRAD